MLFIRTKIVILLWLLLTMDIFGGIRRFAGDAIAGAQNLFQGKPASAASSQQAMPYGPGGDGSGSGLGQAQQYNPGGVEPRQQAVADTISYAEGTWDGSANEPDYTMRYGDRAGQGSLDITSPHPRDVRSSIYGSGNASNASGAYQFLDNTWEEQNSGVNAPMTPNNQDRAVTNLVEQTGYDYDRGFGDQSHLLSGRWASIPNSSGVSNYDQPTPHTPEELDSFHRDRLERRLEQYRRGQYETR